MILLELKRYIQQHERVSLNDIKNRFDLSETAALGLIAPLLKQGHIQKVSTDSCTSGNCSTTCQQNNAAILFQWLDKPLKPLSIKVQIL